MDELAKLAKELEELLKEEQEQEKQPEPPKQEQEKQPEPKQVEQKQPEAVNSELERLQMYREIGIAKFISKNADLPQMTKLIQPIINKADTLMAQDLQKGILRDDFFEYLEEAKNEIIKELTLTAKQILTYTTPTAKEKPTQPMGVSYKMEDYYNDYKKLLQDYTVKHASIDFMDGWKNEKGLITSIGRGKLEIYEKPDG